MVELIDAKGFGKRRSFLDSLDGHASFWQLVGLTWHVKWEILSVIHITLPNGPGYPREHMSMWHFRYSFQDSMFAYVEMPRGYQCWGDKSMSGQCVILWCYESGQLYCLKQNSKVGPRLVHVHLPLCEVVLQHLVCAIMSFSRCQKLMWKSFR